MVSNVLMNGHLGDVKPFEEKHWIVQKFGGTSVGKFAVNVAEDIVRCVGCIIKAVVFGESTNKDHYLSSASLLDHRIAVVCSARSSYTKAEGTTNR